MDGPPVSCWGTPVISSARTPSSLTDPCHSLRSLILLGKIEALGDLQAKKTEQESILEKRNLGK